MKKKIFGILTSLMILIGSSPILQSATISLTYDNLSGLISNKKALIFPSNVTFNANVNMGVGIFESYQFGGLTGVGEIPVIGSSSNLLASGIFMTIRTNVAYASDLSVNCRSDTKFTITNAVSGNIALTFINCVPGTSFRIRLVSDGTPRTVTLLSGATLTTLVTNTVTGYGGTDCTTTANKNLLLCGDVDLDLPNKTNILWWAVSQP